MKSMTGYGKSEHTLSGRTLTLEMKAVNNRYLDLNLKTPKNFLFAEDVLRREIQQCVKRGHIDVLFTYTASGEGERGVAVDLPLARGYLDAAKKLRVEFGLENDFNLTALMRTPDVVRPDSGDVDEETLKTLLTDCAREAVSALEKMRVIEGDALQKDIAIRLTNVVQIVAEIKRNSARVTEDYRKKLEMRIRELLGEVQVDEARLLNEAAFFADKSNIDEEIARLLSHTEQMTALLAADEPVGRKLDFLVQELNREANTVCSKANDIEITNFGLQLKCEIEKIREQIQNIE